VKTLRFDNLVGRGYRILCAEGHVFLLTDRGLYSFVDLARRFLNDEPIEGRTTANYLDLEGVDVSLSVDRAMLVVMPGQVNRIDIEKLVGGRGLLGEMTSQDTGQETWDSLPNSAWSHTVVMEFPLVA